MIKSIIGALAITVVSSFSAGAAGAKIIERAVIHHHKPVKEVVSPKIDAKRHAMIHRGHGSKA